LKTLVKSCIIVLVLCSVSGLLFAWGFWGHQRINKMAVFTLPPQMIGFYKRNIEYIETHAVDPDKRRNVTEDEAPRHYIDIDRYGDHPFDSIPEHWNDAVKKYGEDTLKAHGIVPWHIQVMLGRLTNAFKDKNVRLILHYSADIGHYIADAHVPLHVTKNYNGQLTNQVGIHGFWESRIPELFGDNYDYMVGRSHYLENPLKETWGIIKASFAAHDSVLTFERKLNEEFPSDRKYSFEQRGSTTVKAYSKEYSAAYDKMLDGMVERRMRQSIIAVGSFWYTAWVNAGSPDIQFLERYKMSDEELKRMQEEDRMWRTGKAPANSRGHSDE